MKIKLLLFLVINISISSFSQNLGINTPNPTKGKLEVSGAIGTTSAIFGGDGAGISFQRNYPTIGFNQYYNNGSFIMVPGTAFVQYLDMPSGNLVLDTYSAASSFNQPAFGQTRRLTISQNGNIAIASTEKNASLFVSGHIQGITTARFKGTTYDTRFAERITGQPLQHTYINAGKNGSHVFIHDQGLGNVLIGGGTTRVGINSQDPQAVLELKQVAGTGLMLVSPAFSFNRWAFVVHHETNEAGSDLWMYYNDQYRGNFFHVDGLYYKLSDSRFKKNISSLPSSLNKVMKMRPVSYEMKFDNPGKIESIGFIAQEVRALFPELISISNEAEHGYKSITDLHSMNYDALAPIVIKAIQEQQQKIKTLKQKNDALRTRIDAAEKALTTLNN